MNQLANAELLQPTATSSGSAILGQIVALGLSALPAFALQSGVVDQMLKAREQHHRLVLPSSSATAQTVRISLDEQIDVDLLSQLARVFNDLSKAQTDLDTGAKRVLYEHLWELYTSASPALWQN
jgi:hypothetical protein